MKIFATFAPAFADILAWSASKFLASSCDGPQIRFELEDPPYANYFYSDCNSASQIVITSPLTTSNLEVIRPRLLVAWPAGNSGLVTFFQPQNGVKGSLSISLVNSSESNHFVDPVYGTSPNNDQMFGITSTFRLNSSAILTTPILGSIRTIRDFTEGNTLSPDIQDAIEIFQSGDGGVGLKRLWLDGVTSTILSFVAVSSNASVSVVDNDIRFEAGLYRFNASFNYPQLKQLSPEAVLNSEAQDLLTEETEQTQALSFLAYSNKLLAGAWRFLTYFGRDSMISMLLLEPVLSTGNGSAFEAGITAVLERINSSDGEVAHEETIGDYATYLNLRNGRNSTTPVYDYKMIDTDFFLPIVLADYFVKNENGRDRLSSVFQKLARENPANEGLTYGELALLNSERIMRLAAPFASSGGQVIGNLIHLKDGEPVGQWRDSNTGLGGGRIPFDVNTALVPAALRAIAILSDAGVFPEHLEWKQTANNYAQIWEDETLQFFEVLVTQNEAQSLLDDYVVSNNFTFPSHVEDVNSDVVFYAVALGGKDEQEPVKVMHTDDCFRHFLLNTTNQSQLSSFLSQTADHILKLYPAGLGTDIGVIVANPAYAGRANYVVNFKNSDYHGTVVWSWQLSMMAAGLERQLGRCLAQEKIPEFCNNDGLHEKILMAYNKLWDMIEANSANLGSEVWSWRFEKGKFVSVALGELTSTESNIRQLWSLTFLAVRRNEAFKSM